MKISWAVFEIIEAMYTAPMLKLRKAGFKTERGAKRYVQHPAMKHKGSFVVLEVIEMPGKTKTGEE